MKRHLQVHTQPIRLFRRLAERNFPCLFAELEIDAQVMQMKRSQAGKLLGSERLAVARNAQTDERQRPNRRRLEVDHNHFRLFWRHRCD
ncbi:MAG: hypothetical protein ACK47M_00765 [Caldilinea sp.]